MLTWGPCRPSWCTGTQYGYRASGTCTDETCGCNESDITTDKTTRKLQKKYLQSGFVGGGVVGQPTTVSEALHHLDAENKHLDIKSVTWCCDANIISIANSNLSAGWCLYQN